jgi:hypothetical protein
VVVELAGNERADHEVAGLEGLVDGRRLVHPPGDRLEVADGEAERPQVAIPADQVERVMRVVVGGDAIGAPHLDRELTTVLARCHELRRMDVALGIRGVFEQLPVVVAVALGRLDLRGRLEVQDALGRALVRVQSPGRPDRQDEVVARAVAERTEDRVADAGPLVDEEHLVGDAVAVEHAVGHRAGGSHDAEHHIVIEVQGDPTGDDVSLRLDPAGLGQAMAVQAVVGRLQPHLRHRLDAMRARRRRQVIQQRRSPGEALDPEQLLSVERAVRRAMLGVALLGNAAALDVVHGATGLLASRRPV